LAKVITTILDTFNNTFAEELITKEFDELMEIYREFKYAK